MMLKEGVNIAGIYSEIVLALLIVERVFDNNNQELVITSVLDGKQMRGPLHYACLLRILMASSMSYIQALGPITTWY